MKVVIINHSDSKGGASVASYQLFRALRQQGEDARMLVVHRTIDDPNIALLTPTWRNKAAFLTEHAEIFALNGLSRKHLFKASIATCGMNVHDHPWVREADIVVLGWINQGMLSLAEISRIPKPVVWIMHDMWCMTGVCHHAGKCQRYLDTCGNCPLLFNSRFHHDLSSCTQQRKQKLYAKRQIHFVAVSQWLMSKARSSALLRHQPIHLITNPVDTSRFRLSPKHHREHYGLPSDSRLVVMAAARLDDPIKGLDIAVDALNQLIDLPDVAALFIGNLRDPHALDSLRIPYYCVGSVSDPEVLADLYAHSSVVLSTSHYESLGLTLIEGMASGCVPVTFGTGGQTDIVDHKTSGYIARYPNAADIAQGIRYALSGAIDPSHLRQQAISRFGNAEVAKRYISLFKSIFLKKLFFQKSDNTSI